MYRRTEHAAGLRRFLVARDTSLAFLSAEVSDASPGVAKNCRSRGHNYWSITCRGPIRSITFLWQPVHANVLPCKWYIYFALLERAYAARTRIYAKLVSKGPPNLWQGPQAAPGAAFGHPCSLSRLVARTYCAAVHREYHCRPGARAAYVRS